MVGEFLSPLGTWLPSKKKILVWFTKIGVYFLKFN